jgi:leucyl aminopeptidase
MGVTVEVIPPDQLEADVIGVFIADPDNGFVGQPKLLDERLHGRLSRLAADGELKGDLGESLVLHLDGELNARRVAAAGVGHRDALDADALRTAAATVAEKARGTLAWVIDDSLGLPPQEQARAIVEGTILGAYDPARWKTQRNDTREISRIVLATDDRAVAEVAQRAARVAEWTNRARDLANAPPNELNPKGLAQRARDFAGEVGHLTVQALGRDEARELGMGSFLAVGQGSANEPQLIVVRYEPPSPKRADVTVGLVGKAITFDSGGISLKPSLKLYDMKGDMAGGGAVVSGVAAVADLGIPVRILAVVAAAENLPGSTAYRPGDILRAANGKTIEITNTDAEGRLVLADALWYARREGATHILDFATLTGAMETALGDLYAGVFANDDEWRDRIVRAGERSGDLVWPFPLHRRYRRYIDSDYADMKNSSELKQAGAVLAAKFLEEFVGEGPWAHIDMPGPGFLERSRGDYMTKPGGTGYGVRLIVELAQSLAE